MLTTKPRYPPSSLPPAGSESIDRVGQPISTEHNMETSKIQSEHVIAQHIANQHPNEKLSNTTRIITSLAAGACAGAVAKTVIAPLDRTKIYFQTHPDKRYRFKGALKFLSKTYGETGFFSLWRGNSATLARVMPYSAINFMSHEQYKRLFGIDVKGQSTPDYMRFVAGALAGMTGQALTYPLDRARAVLAVTKAGDYRNLIIVFQRIVHEEGYRALYRGLTPTILGVIPYAGTSFFCYEMLKKFWTHRAIEENREVKAPTTIERMGSGAVAGIIGQTASYPLDIVRRRMQTAKQMGINGNRYTSIIGTLAYVLRKEGFIHGWYKGLSMNFIKGPIAAGTSFACYDIFVMSMRKVVHRLQSNDDDDDNN